MKKVCILSSREVGYECIEWAKINTPPGLTIVDDPKNSDIVISVLYDKILKQDILNNRKCFNFHPGILPEYRGSGAFSWCLINQEQKTGITLHLMDNGIDTGDIIEIREFIISNDDTAYTLHSRGQKVIFKMFKDWYVDLVKEEYTAIPQPQSSARTYYRKNLDHAKDLSKYIRAFHFPDKEPAYYFDDSNAKCYIKFNSPKKI